MTKLHKSSQIYICQREFLRISQSLQRNNIFFITCSYRHVIKIDFASAQRYNIKNCEIIIETSQRYNTYKTRFIINKFVCLYHFQLLQKNKLIFTVIEYITSKQTVKYVFLMYNFLSLSLF